MLLPHYVKLDHMYMYRCFCFQLALLCGAPGLGKTTLGHIIAHHAGYHVVEINARLVMLLCCIRHTIHIVCKHSA